MFVTWKARAGAFARPTEVFATSSQSEHEDHRRIAEVLHLGRTRQLVPGVAEQAGRNGDVLLAVDRIAHRRRVEAGADIDAPELLQRLVVERDDRAVKERRDHDAAGGRERAGKI